MNRNTYEIGLWAMMAEVFKGPNAWLAWLAITFITVFLGLTVWVLIQFLNAVEAMEAVRWLAGLMALILAVSMLKLWFWTEMQTNKIIRAIRDKSDSE